MFVISSKLDFFTCGHQMTEGNYKEVTAGTVFRWCNPAMWRSDKGQRKLTTILIFCSLILLFLFM